MSDREKTKEQLIKELQHLRQQMSHLQVAEDERLQTEQALRQQRTEQQIIFDSVPAMIWYKDTENRILRLNQAAAATMGLPAEAIEGRSVYELNPAEAEHYHQDDLEVINSGKPKLAIVEPLVTASGEKRWLQTDKIPYRGEGGYITGVIVFATDITERVRAEEALRKAQEDLEQRVEERTAALVEASSRLEKEVIEHRQAEKALEREHDLLQALMDTVPDMIFFKDAKSRIIRSNRAHTKFLGFSDPEEVVGKTDFDLFSAEDAPGFFEEEQQIIRSGQAIIDRVGQTPDLRTGEIRWLSETKVPMRDESGQVSGLVGIARDITARRQAEIELERRTAQLQTAAEVSRAAGGILEPDELIQRVVDLVQERFGLYYVGLFLVDRSGEWSGEPGKWAVLRAGSGEAGQSMLSAGHKLEIGGESMIGWCVANKQPRIALDVGEEAVHFQNPFLPATRSEMALPLIARGQVIGAMSVQSEEEAAFSDEDIAVLQTMADQLAVAIENAHLFEQTQAEIAERETAEEALRVSEERFSLAVRGSQDGIWDWDIQNGSLYWSPRLKELLGYADDELDIDFDTFDSMLHPDDKEGVGAAIETHLRDRTAYDVEERLRTKSGEYRWFRARGQAIWDEVRQPLRMTGSTTDITERKQAEAERERLLTDLEYRSTQLQTASEVSRAAGSILDPDELIEQVVDLVQERFDLYYVGLFLVDRSGEWSGEPDKWAVLRAGSGEAGQSMLSAGHKLEIGGESMIGWCVANKQPRIALDVGEEAVHFQNPFLPATRSEMALPLIARGQVIGAMSVQSEEEAAFSDEDIAVLQTMADQLTVAIENARLFEQTQAALAEVEATHRSYLRQRWKDYLEQQETLLRSEVVSDQTLASALAESPAPTIESGQVPAISGAGEEGAGLTIPIVLRGQAIGVLGLEDPQGTREWSEEDQALAEAVSQQLALALENARLLEETQRSAARERVVREITDEMRRATDMDSLMQTAVREMAAALGTSSAFVQLGMLPEQGGEEGENGNVSSGNMTRNQQPRTLG